MTATTNITAPIERTREETIAELARSVSKPSDRAQAFKAVRRLLQDVARNEALNDNAVDLARLYAFFLPKPSPKARSPFDWVAKAVGKNDVRYYLNFVYVTVDEIVGTDGSSLHIAPNAEGREPGYYGAEGVRLHAPDYARYPNYQRVQPDPESRDRKWFQLSLSDLDLATTTDGKGGVFNYYKLPTGKGLESQERVHVDAKLMKRLVSLDPGERISVNVGGMADSVLVKLSGKRTAVVVPLRQ